MDFLTAWTWPLQIEPVLMVWAQIKPYLLAFCTKSVVETVPSFCTLFTSLFCLSHLVNPRDKLETALGYLFGIVQQLTIAVAMKSFLVYRAWLFSQYSEPDAELLTRPLFVIQFAPILIGLLTTQEFGPISLWLALDAAAMILYVPQTWITVMHSVVLMWPIANIIFNLFFYYADALEQAVEEIRFFWNHRGHFWIIDAANMFHWQPSIASYWMVRTTWILCRHAPSWLVSIPQIMSLEYSTIIEYWQNLSIETMPAFLQDFLLLSTETIVCVYGFAVSLGYMYDILEDICIRLLKTENRQDTIFLSSGGIVAVYFSTMAFELNMIPHSMPERVQLTLQLLSISVLVFLWPLFQLIRTRLETLQVERQYSFSNQFVPILLSSMILVVCASQTWHIYQEGMKDCWSMAVMVYSIQTFVSVSVGCNLHILTTSFQRLVLISYHFLSVRFSV